MRTEVVVKKADLPFEYGQKIMFMGSCFSEHVGERLVKRKFNVDLNPFGVLFNPVSIASGIQRMLHQKEYDENDLFFHQGWWHSFDHHSVFSNPDKIQCLKNINDRLVFSGQTIKDARYIFVTFGTARVYHQKSNGKVVSNCHQIPNSFFENQLLRVGDIVRMYSLLIHEIAALNPEVKWIFTVSPVRHWKDGPEGNQISKATLLLAVNELNAKFEQLAYFPAYEIFMDDLRDYRYYADDLLHPGSQGIDYTWKKFVDAYISEASQLKMKAIENLIRSKNHRPRNENSEEYLDFRRTQFEKALEMSKENPDIDLTEFLEFFSPIIP